MSLLSSTQANPLFDLNINPSHLDLYLERLTSITDSTLTSFTAQELVNYGHIRYHILVSYDSLTSDSAPEKALLQACQSALRYDSYDNESRAEAISSAFQAFDKWWENILKSDYILRSSHGATQGGYVAGATGRSLVRLRIFTASDGRVQTSSHTEEIPWPRHQPIRNLWPQLRPFQNLDIRVVGRRVPRLGLPVEIRRAGRRSGEVCFLQSLQQSLHPDYFTNMINNHILVLGEPRFAQIVGIRESEDDSKIDGVLRHAQKGRFLDQILQEPENVSRELKTKWRREVGEAVKRGAELGLKLENLTLRDVFVTDEGLDVILYGLGTPATSGGSSAGCEFTESIRGASPIMRYLEELM